MFESLNKTANSFIERLKIMKIFISFLAVALVACSSDPISTQADDLRSRYLNDPTTSETIKAAIRSGVVIPGMCPFQAFAAAGLPGPYMVKSDKEKWGPGVPPPTIISAQCEHPDHSTIELMFRNTTQFQSSMPVVFRVRFVDGKATLVDQKNFNE
jgi:hypothetical protein